MSILRTAGSSGYFASVWFVFRSGLTSRPPKAPTSRGAVLPHCCARESSLSQLSRTARGTITINAVGYSLQEHPTRRRTTCVFRVFEPKTMGAC